MKRPIRILLADDHLLVRAGLRALLEKSPSMKVVAEAADSSQVLRLARIRKPDVVVMDAALANHNGLHTTVRLHQGQRPRIPVVLLSMDRDGEEAVQALRASASAYLLMKSKPAELGLAIRKVVKGQKYVDSSISAQNRPTSTARCEGRLPSRPVLTARQRETLRLIGEGKNTKEIATLLGVSPKTVEFHRMQLMERLRTRTIAGLVRHAIRLGMVTANHITHT